MGLHVPPLVVVAMLLLLTAAPTKAEHDQAHAIVEAAAGAGDLVMAHSAGPAIDAVNPGNICVVNSGLECCQWGAQAIFEGDATETPDVGDIQQWNWVVFVYIPILAGAVVKGGEAAISASPGEAQRGLGAILMAALGIQGAWDGLGVEGYRDDTGCRTWA